MITVETKPVRMLALQWNKPGDGSELAGVIESYRLGNQQRWGVVSLQGTQPLHPGDWIVISGSRAQVYSPGEFAQKFNVIDEGESHA
ncbi:MAG: hypothetical protein HYX47_10445 [Burkholderiales bacterium]|nr:hypothetical protein [Burkholderiales bacterium]